MSAHDDLHISRVIRAPREALWNAWTDPRSFERWWIPAPMVMRVVDMDLSAGGAFVTEMSEDGKTFTPHMDACFLAVEPMRRLVFTTVMTGGWRPVDSPFIHMTADISFNDHPDGIEYAARVMHSTDAERDKHVEMGFHDGWGTVLDQLKVLLESRA